MQVVVRWPGGSDSIVISVETQSANKILNRDPTEPVVKSLGRLQASLGGEQLAVSCCLACDCVCWIQRFDTLRACSSPS